jgi:hypothetical protein
MLLKLSTFFLQQQNVTVAKIKKAVLMLVIFLA